MPSSWSQQLLVRFPCRLTEPIINMTNLVAYANSTELLSAHPFNGINSMLLRLNVMHSCCSIYSTAGELYPAYNTLMSTIPNELGLLSKLTDLDLSLNQVIGTVLTSLTSLLLSCFCTILQLLFLIVCILCFAEFLWPLYDKDLTGSLDWSTP